MVLGIEGFDYCSADQCGRKYVEGGGKQASIVDGRQAPGRPGGGYGLFCFNTAFDFNWRTRVFASRHTWIVGANMQINNFAGFSPAMLFWRFCSAVENSNGSNSHTQLSIGWNTLGQLEFYAGGDGVRQTIGSAGSLIATTTYALPLNTWQYVEIKITFGHGGRIQVWAEDLLVFDQSGLEIGHASDFTDPDRMDHVFQNFGTIGIILDDEYVADTLGTVNNDRLGPCRVSTVYPSVDIAAAWARNAGAGNWTCVDDPGPTGADDTATELTGTAGQLDLYNVTRPACFGKVLAIAANLCAHGVAGTSHVDLVSQTSTRDVATRYDIAAGLVVPAAYTAASPIPASIVQAILNSSPINNGIWRDGDIFNATWGMRAQGNVKATQFFIEKLTSLRSQHYDCGGGSYVF